MIISVPYVGMEDRKRQVAIHEGRQLRMISDTFVLGQVDAGTMIFTDDPAPAAPYRDLAAEVTALAKRVTRLDGG